MDLLKEVVDKCVELGPLEAARFFGVSTQTIRNWVKGKSVPSVVAAQTLLNNREDHEPGPDRSLVMWEGRNVIMLLPVYRTINPKTHFTLFANYAKYGPEKIGMEMKERTVIHECRNFLVHKFLKTTAEWCIMCDDDMVLPCGNEKLMNGNYKANLPRNIASVVALSRIMSHPKEVGVVGALYFGRHGKGRAQCASAFESDAANKELHHVGAMSLRPERWVATGLLRIHRSVFERLIAAIPEKWPHLAPKHPDRPYGFFTPEIVGQGEDVVFGLRCGAIGIQSYVDTGLVCLHEGSELYGPNNTQDYSPVTL